jgi:hypothetical protein
LDLSDNQLHSYGCRILELAKKGSEVILDLKGNHQAFAGGETPVSVADVVQGVLHGVTQISDVDELRRRVSHPALRAADRPKPHS